MVSQDHTTFLEHNSKQLVANVSTIIVWVFLENLWPVFLYVVVARYPKYAYSWGDYEPRHSLSFKCLFKGLGTNKVVDNLPAIYVHTSADQTKYLVSTNPTRNPRGGLVGRCSRSIHTCKSLSWLDMKNKMLQRTFGFSTPTHCVCETHSFKN